jgi:hypothetical protein
MNAKAALFCAAALALAGEVRAQGADPLASLAATVTLATADSLTLTEQAHGVSSTRTLKLGDEYKQGWRLEKLSATDASFRKGPQVRTIAFGALAAANEASADKVVGAAANLTNAVAGDRPRPADRSRIAAAIAARDPAQVVALGGSAREAFEALGRTGPIADILNQGGEARYVAMPNGQLGVQVRSDEGGRGINMTVVPPQLQGVPAPAGTETFTPPAAAGGDNLVIRQIPAPAQ